MKLKTMLLLPLVFVASVSSAQKEKEDKWDVNNPPGPYKEVSFNTTEGTWMNLDVSPDGKEIVFDLLGDIYIMPATGGEARLIKGDHAWDVQPRFSPDGKKISFTSDGGGGDNIWMMNKDGSDPTQITKESFRLLNNGVWSPDGNYIVARKHFTSTRSAGAGELWMYHTSGGEGVMLTKRKNEQQDLGEPCYSPDGKYIYYSEDMYPGGYFQYNKDPNNQIYVIKRYDTGNGDIETVTGGVGSAFRPQISPNGKLLAYVKRVREQTVLYLRNMETGEEWPVYDQLSKDQQEAWAIFGVYTNFNWMPNDEEIVIWAQGKIKKVNVNTLAVADISFSLKSTHRIYEAIHNIHLAATDSFDVKAIRQTVTSPDEKTIVFNAAGYLWIKNLPEGKPTRLTSGTAFEFEPCFSPDGKSLAFVTWHDELTGTISILPLGKKGGKPAAVTTEKGIYRTPRFSPDGNTLVYEKENGNDHQGYAFCVKPGIYTIPAKGGKPTFIIKDASEPYFNADGTKIFFMGSEGEGRALKSYDLKEKKEQTHFTAKNVTSIVPSPDNKWVAFVEFYKVYVNTFPPSGKSIELTAGMKAMPVAQLAKDAGISLHWSVKSDKLFWTEGDEYFVNPINKRFTFLEGAPDSVPPPDSTGLKIGLRLASDKPKGMIAFTGARILTMNNQNEVIENGTILVKENKIAGIGKAGDVIIPADAYKVDATGKTIMPGMVDVHAHLGTFRQGLSPQKQWSYFANLAYGVTTTHDPSSNTEMVFSQSEMVKAGYAAGPRIFSTGWILYGAEGDYKTKIEKPEDAVSALKRTMAFGAFSVKSYNQPRRDQRQMVIDAGRKLGINVYPEGGSHFFHNMTMILDGHTGIEHNVPVAPLYNDVISLWKESNTGNTPTLIVSYGSMTGENYFYQKYNVWENKKLLTFTPRFIIDSRSRHRTMIPDEEFEIGHILVSQSLKKLADAGVRINIGSHGQLQGLGAHWELWMLAQGGMTNMQALACATKNGAWYIGMDKDLGSLEKGKLADLIVLEKNPLDDIRNSESIVYTMANGRLYDTATMNQIGNEKSTRTKFYWENMKTGNSFPWHMHTDGHGHGDGD